jgi:hypothetical protein
MSLAPIIARLDPDGSLSLRALAARLTTDGLPTPAGAAVWTAAGVAHVKARLAAKNARLAPSKNKGRREAALQMLSGSPDQAMEGTIRPPCAFR